jgi:hypothetical protein
MEQKRVAELHDPHRKSGGTGYLIRDDLVLTAHHVIAPLGKPGALGTRYHIRFIGDYDQGRTDWVKEGCCLCWDAPEPKYDLALLKLIEKPKFLSSQRNVVRFGRLGDETQLAEGTGFPLVQEILHRQNPEPLEGRLSRIAGLKERQIRLQVTSPVPDSSSQWQGISGTALFVKECLVGVVIETNKSFAEKVLWATPISLITSQNAEFCQIVFGNANVQLKNLDSKKSRMWIVWASLAVLMLTFSIYFAVSFDYPEPRVSEYEQALLDGYEFLEEGELDEADKKFNKARNIRQNLPEPWYWKANVALERQNKPTALEYANKSLELDPQHIYSWELKIKLLLLSGGDQMEEAEKIAQKSFGISDKLDSWLDCLNKEGFFTLKITTASELNKKCPPIVYNQTYSENMKNER